MFINIRPFGKIQTLYSSYEYIFIIVMYVRTEFGVDHMAYKKSYKCNKCGFEWHSPQKTYTKCPDCGSEDINTISAGDNPQRPVGQPGQGRRRGYGGSGIGAGPPSKCKCTQCGYETVKTPGVPCRTSNCPECGALMCGAD